MSPGLHMLWVKLSSLFVVSAFSFTAFAQNCPPVLKSDAGMYSQLKVSTVDQNGKISTSEKGLNLKEAKGKVSVVRLFATWCPYCKKDLQQLNEKFSSLIKDEKLELSLVLFESRRESDESIELFLKQGSQELGVEKSNFKWLYSRMKSADLKDLNAKGDKKEKAELLFPGFQGVPYGLVFDAQGRLRFQGHFTGDDDVQNKHYEMIAGLASGKCS